MSVQESFGFAADNLSFIRRALASRFGPVDLEQRRHPVWQLVRSRIGARTLDAGALAALHRLRMRWPRLGDFAAASADEIEDLIREVAYPEQKASQLHEALRLIGRERPDFNLAFLRALSVPEALGWLERLPGIGQKVAASTLNASALRMRVFIVDCHVHRILLRFGLIGAHAGARVGRDMVTATATGFDADDLRELFAHMKRLGQTVCRPGAPRCGACPLASRCQRRAELGVVDRDEDAERPRRYAA